ncbi:DUF397 domain-containing protein [Streptomyces sp. NPDC001658]
MPVGSQSVSQAIWFKSSYSGGNTTECVETAFVPAGVAVRDSKRPTIGHLVVSPTAWAGFIAGARRMER